MGYLELVDNYTSITKEIGFIEKLMRRDNDLALKRKLSQLRKEQKELRDKIDEYNGVIYDGR